MTLIYKIPWLFIYYIIGFFVSGFFIWRYRYSKYATNYHLSDSLSALIGPWIWPLQILYFLYLTISKSNNN